MGISDFISHYLSAPDSQWSFVSLTFAAMFLVFFAIYIVLRKWSKAVTLGYVVVFSLLFAYKANGILMLLLPTTALLSYYLTRVMAAREGVKVEVHTTVVEQGCLMNIEPFATVRFE